MVKIVGESKGENRLASRGENNTDSKVEYKVINTSQYKDEERRLKDAYKQKLKEWKDLKKIEPTTPMPVKPTIKKIGDTFQTQKIAQEYAQKLNDEEADKDNPARNRAELIAIPFGHFLSLAVPSIPAHSRDRAFVVNLPVPRSGPLSPARICT